MNATGSSADSAEFLPITKCHTCKRRCHFWFAGDESDGGWFEIPPRRVPTGATRGRIVGVKKRVAGTWPLYEEGAIKTLAPYVCEKWSNKIAAYFERGIRAVRIEFDAVPSSDSGR